jgi:hypothetical protein
MKSLAWLILMLAIPASAVPAQAAPISLSGTLWMCTRATDASQFVITFYPDRGVGGGEFQAGEVSPYVFDTSRTNEGRWPGHWEQTGQSFTWSFPDQHMRIVGKVSAKGSAATALTGSETGYTSRSAVACKPIPRLPKIGSGLVIPSDGHFLDQGTRSGEEGSLKVPTGISLPEAPRPD